MKTENKRGATHCAISHNGQILTATFANGKTVSVDISNLSETAKIAAIMYGLSNKLSNAAALPRDTMTGKPASIDEKFDAVAAVAERLNSGGDWNIVATGGGKSEGKIRPLLIETLLLYSASKGSQKTREEVTAQVMAMDIDRCRGYNKLPVLLPFFIEAAAKMAQPADSDLADELLADL